MIRRPTCRRTARIGALAAIVLAMAASQTLAGEQCFTDWSDAAPVVASEHLRSASEVQGEAREKVGGEVVRITLCQNEDGYFYRLVMRRHDGRIGNLKMSATAE